MMPDQKTIQDFFVRGISQGWIAGAKPVTLPDMPGYHCMPYREDDLYLLDCYCFNRDSSKGAGSTTIWYKDTPVWILNYHGLYYSKAMPFLRSVLRKAYEEKRFFGGRGPLIFRKDPYLYINRPESDEFTDFKGREEILNLKTKELLGWNEYRGFSLIDLS